MAAAQTTASAAPLEKANERPSALRSIIAGSTAGAVEIGMFFCLLFLLSCVVWL
jgi:hypothetical protein